jgi:uncharacterized protein (TIGR02246 family)
MKLRYVVAASLCLIAGTHSNRAFNAQRSEDDQVQNAINDGNARYISAFANGDAQAFANLYDVKGARLGDDGNGSVTRGHDAIARSADKFIKAVNGTVAVTADTQRLYVVDDLAYEEGKYTLTYVLRGEAAERHVVGQYVTVWKRQRDGGWKIYADMPVPSVDVN